MVWLVLAIAVWGVVHSWLASVQAKDILHNWLGDNAMTGYRLLYNIFAVLTFAPILLLARILPDRTLYTVQAPCLYVMLAGQGLAAILLFLAFLQTDPLSFVGLSQFWQGERSSTLVIKGFYGIVRHPLYLFGLLFIWLSPIMTVNMLVVYLSLTIYILIGAYFEERKLLREFGEQYAEYRARTPMIIPSVIGRNKQ